MRKVIFTIFAICITVFSIQAQEQVQIELPEFIVVGQALDITIALDNPTEVINSTLLSGLQQHQATVEINNNSSASILFEENIITTAGTTILFITIEDKIYTRTIQILPDEPAEIDLFATGNAILAYGEGNAQLISFLYDVYGNPIHNHLLTFTSQSPDGQLTQNNTVVTQYGRTSATISSLRNPGVLNVDVAIDNLSQTLQLLQFPTQPNTISLTISPDCLLVGRSETIYLEAQLIDRYGFAVQDGTQVIFQWDDGIAFGTSINGVASLSLPPFEEIGLYNFSVQAGIASDFASFQIAKDVCA